MTDKKNRLLAIVGSEGVTENPGLGEAPSLDHRLLTYQSPSFLSKPRSVDEVQQLVLWANETGTPLVPVSSGGPHFRGDTWPTVPESVLVDLSGMDRILRVDRRNRLAVIEPGVTFGQLQPELQAAGLRLITPLLPRVGKSVLASLLEREPLISPKYQWNLLEPLRSLEIVWGNGDKFYSGSGTFRGEREEDWQKGLVPVHGPGPGQLDFYRFVSAAQGSMGIVTWASMKCEVYPESRSLLLVPAQRLEQLIDFVYRLLRFRFGDELFIVNNTCLASLLGWDAGAVSSLKVKLPLWTAVVGITGGSILPRERVQAQEDDIAEIAQRFGLEMMTDLPDCSGSELGELLLEPSGELYWKLRAKGGMQELFFLTTLDRTPGYVETLYGAADEHRYPVADIGAYIQPVHQGVGCHCEFILPFDPHSEAEMWRAAALFRDASRRLFDEKAFFSRPYGIWADMVYRADARTTTVTRKMKDIFDPNHVMNPGKLCFDMNGSR